MTCQTIVPPAPSFRDRLPASGGASAAARGASRKVDTRCEVLLRRVLWRQGCRFKKNVGNLPGKPDVVFSRARLVVFCDGDFWHGRDWESRKSKLARGNNATYWMAKIERNRERDRQQVHLLESDGWTVIRLWETEVLRDPAAATTPIMGLLATRGHFRVQRRAKA